MHGSARICADGVQSSFGLCVFVVSGVLQLGYVKGENLVI